MSKLIFLSHIHEEAKLAQIIQAAIEDEFSGFVEVFVSSDGKTIPAGANFLKRIEDGLISCVGALYLISPTSVKRNWVNFELGAVWIRNSIAVRNGENEIPTVPICHSGMTPSTLPMPLINLTAIQANSASQLELAFKSIQTAVGGKGKLKTDFDELTQKISQLERIYTLGDSLKTLLTALAVNSEQLKTIILKCRTLVKGTALEMKMEKMHVTSFQTVKDLENGNLRGHIKATMSNHAMVMSDNGMFNVGDASIIINAEDILDFSDQLTTWIN